MVIVGFPLRRIDRVVGPRDPITTETSWEPGTRILQILFKGRIFSLQI